MLQDIGAVNQALLGTLFTWGLTALGAAFVFIFHSGQRKFLDGSLGFAAGVMLAASYWSLLAPALEMAAQSGYYGSEGQYSYIPVSIGFLLGALFVQGADIALSSMGISGNIAASLSDNPKSYETDDSTTEMNSSLDSVEKGGTSSVIHRRKQANNSSTVSNSDEFYTAKESSKQASWRRIMLLIVAITVHNFPEGLAVGVAFGAIGKTPSATFANARNLAIGIGIQNFPEGLAVSLPLRGAGLGLWKSFWYGQLSGMVEPIAGVLGAYAVVIAEPLLPYALAFAAGAMVFVVNDDIIPEAQLCGNGRLATWTSILGFIVMMSLDVGLG